MCRNDELISTMSWVGCLLPDSELFILYVENCLILLIFSVITILLTLMYLVALNLLVNNQLNSSLNSTHNCNWLHLKKILKHKINFYKKYKNYYIVG